MHLLANYLVYTALAATDASRRTSAEQTTDKCNINLDSLNLPPDEHG